MTERAPTTASEFWLGDNVSKTGGDYRFDGIVVAKFAKLSGIVRYVVEDDRGVLHIYSRANLRLQTKPIG